MTYGEWQPIETAPRGGDDEESVSILTFPHYRVTHWSADDKAFVRFSEYIEDYVPIDLPTHWMPLPPPPKGEGT